MKPIIQTRSGSYLNLLDPDPDRIDIEDIAHSLSLQCRFNGHCSEFYSVAQHSVLVSYNVPEHLALAGLLHDAAEAYIGDITAPLKYQLPSVKDIESVIHDAIAEKFGIVKGKPDEIHMADLLLLVTEARDLMNVEAGPNQDYWDFGMEPLKQVIIPWDPAYSKEAFLDRFEELSGKY